MARFNRLSCFHNSHHHHHDFSSNQYKTHGLVLKKRGIKQDKRKASVNEGEQNCPLNHTISFHHHRHPFKTQHPQKKAKRNRHNPSFPRFPKQAPNHNAKHRYHNENIKEKNRDSPLHNGETAKDPPEPYFPTTLPKGKKILLKWK